MALNEALQYILDRTENAYLSDQELEESEEPDYVDLGREVMLITQCYEEGELSSYTPGYSPLMISCETVEKQEIYVNHHGSL
jgi:hypothetical protein